MHLCTGTPFKSSTLPPAPVSYDRINLRAGDLHTRQRRGLRVAALAQPRHLPLDRRQHAHERVTGRRRPMRGGGLQGLALAPLRSEGCL